MGAAWLQLPRDVTMLHGHLLMMLLMEHQMGGKTGASGVAKLWARKATHREADSSSLYGDGY